MNMQLNPTVLELRDYQSEAVDALRHGILNGNQRQVLCLPTGAGKTETAVGLIKLAVERGGKVIFVVDRLTLKDQSVFRFEKYGLKVGVIQGSNTSYSIDDDCYVATAQTLLKRMEKNPLSLPVTLVVIDECHVVHQAHRLLFERMPKTPVVGLSATPHHAELGTLYAGMISGITIKDLIDRKMLVPFRVFVPSAQIDTSSVKMGAGEFRDRELVDNATKITADIISNWASHGEGRPTICFCVNVSHAEQTSYQFNQAGFASDYIYYKTEAEDREQMFDQLRTGEIKVLCCVTTLTTGFDMPEASCAIVARPTASEALHIQMLGRVARACDGKSDSLVFDHAGNCDRHGLPQDYMPPTLEEASARAKKRRERTGERTFASCPDCGWVMQPRQRVCTECGHERQLAADVLVVDGVLVEVGKEVGKEVEESYWFRYRFLSELMGYQKTARKKDGSPYNPRWAAVNFMTRFGDFPSKFGIKDRHIWPTEPGPAVLRWIHNRNTYKRIRMAKGRRRQG